MLTLTNLYQASMNIIRPDSLPRLWWLTPWSAARHLHKCVGALKQYCDRIDRAIDLQCQVISDQSTEITQLRFRVSEMHDKLVAAQQSREHWIAKHDRAHAVAMHNERVIMRLEDCITAGAIVPDATPEI